MPGRVFISYRGDDDQGYARALHKELAPAVVAEQAKADRVSLVACCWILLAYALASIYAANYNRGLYADGSYYLVRMAETQDFLLFDPARTTVQIIRQFPVIMLQHWGDLSLAQLGQVFSLSMLLIPVALCAVCWPILPSGRKSWIFFPILHILAGVSASRFAAIAEGAIAASYFWPLLFLLLFRTRGAAGQLLFLGMLLPAFCLHETVILLMTILAVVCVLCLRRKQERGSRIFLMVSTAIIVLIAAHELYWIIFPRFAADRAAYFSSLLGLKFLVSDGRANLPLITGILGLAAFIAVAFMNMRAPARMKWHPMAVSFVFLSFALAATWSACYSDLGFTPNAQLQARNQAVFISSIVAALAVMVTIHKFSASGWVNAPTMLILAALSVAQLAWDVAATNRWRSYINDLRERLASSVGFIYYEQSFYSGSPERDINWRLMTAGYAMPTLSIALNTGGPVASLVTAPKNTAWQAFDPSKPDLLPRIRGIEYSPFVIAVTRTKGDQAMR